MTPTNQNLCPTTPGAIAVLFQRLRRDDNDDNWQRAMAHSATKTISDRLNARYGHERPVDWLDHPEAVLLTSGLAAAARIQQYHDHHPTRNDRLKDWNQALTAVALTVNVAAGNAALKAVNKHGQYQARDIFTGGPANSRQPERLEPGIRITATLQE